MGGFVKPIVAYPCSCNFVSIDRIFHKILELSLMGFCTVVVTYSEMLILPNNHIFNLKMRQIARTLLKNVSKNENSSLQLNLDQPLKKLIFWWPPVPLLAYHWHNIQIIRMGNNL